jgi:hypothetical protein
MSERERERDGCGHPKEEKVCDGLWEHEPRALDPKGLHLSRANFYLSLYCVTPLYFLSFVGVYGDKLQECPLLDNGIQFNNSPISS